VKIFTIFLFNIFYHPLNIMFLLLFPNKNNSMKPSRKIFARSLSLSLTLSLTLSLALFSQSGSIEGRVYESTSNNPVPFANVAIYGTSVGVVADEEGRYAFTGLKPGFVRVAATSIGYETYVSDEIYLTNAK
jgi:protocatechuate 3,4-dioxygenase beta subunit